MHFFTILHISDKNEDHFIILSHLRSRCKNEPKYLASYFRQYYHMDDEEQNINDDQDILNLNNDNNNNNNDNNRILYEKILEKIDQIESQGWHILPVDIYIDSEGNVGWSRVNYMPPKEEKIFEDICKACENKQTLFIFDHIEFK